MSTTRPVKTVKKSGNPAIYLVFGVAALLLSAGPLAETVLGTVLTVIVLLLGVVSTVVALVLLVAAHRVLKEKFPISAYFYMVAWMVLSFISYQML